MSVVYQGFTVVCDANFTMSSTQALATVKTLHDAPAYKVGLLVRSLFDSAANGVSQILSSVTHGFRVIDGYAPQFAVASAQTLPISADELKTELTQEEKIFLRDLEVYLKLSFNAKNDRRYLRQVKNHIDTYMVKNEYKSFPQHMMGAITLLTSYLDNVQFNDLWRDVPVLNDEKPLSENCFYEQLEQAVQSARLTHSFKDKMLAVQAVKKLVDIYLAPQNGLFKSHELTKFSKITYPISCLMGDSYPDLVDRDA